MLFGTLRVSVGQLYRATVMVAGVGALALVLTRGLREGTAFALGALVSLGNLWLFERLARGIEPGEQAKKPWQASAFMTRYLLFFAAGYAIVNALGVSPLPVVAGLFASTVGALLLSVSELIGSLFRAGRP